MKLSNILIFAFIFLGLIGSFMGGIFYYTSSVQMREEIAESEILAIGKLKADYIESYIRRLMVEANLIATQSALSEEELRTMSNLAPAIDSMYVLDTEGKVMVSSGETPCGNDLSKNKVFIEGKEKTTFINLYHCQTLGKDMMAIATPFHGGVLVLRIDTQDFENIVNDRSGLGKTGEVLIAIQGEGERVYLFNRLFEKQAINQDQENAETAEPMKEALFGNEMIFKNSLDYRGVPVIAVSQYIALGDMALVAKIDREEVVGVYEKEFLKNALISGGIIFLLAIILGFFVSGIVTKSLKKLTTDINIITKGRLDIQLQKSNISEIKDLTDSLNRILASLKLAILRTGLSKDEMGIGEAVKAKKEAEEKYKILYESSMDAIMTLEPPTWRFTSANPATIELFGAKDEKQFTSLGPGNVSPKKQPDGQLSSEKAKKMIEKAMKQGSNMFEWTHKKLNGKNFAANVLLTRVKVGERVFLQATVRDISRK